MGNITFEVKVIYKSKIDSMIKENLNNILGDLPEGVRLVCVSKFHPVEAICEAYEQGQRDFGESRVQELVQKQPNLPKDIRWHFIGPLQTNKIKYIVPFVHLIQSVENMRQMAEIQKCAARIERRVSILLEVHIAQEEQKHGFLQSELLEFFGEKTYLQYPNIKICGIMTIATLTDDQKQISEEFARAKGIFESVKAIYPDSDFCELSIGMSDDYRLAIEQGSTMVRIGSKIFGQRIYSSAPTE